MLKERGKKIINKIKMRLNSASGIPTLSRVVYSGMFSGPITSFVTTESISGTPEQINPVEILDHTNKITILGTGAIGSLQAISEGQRMVHPSHLGIIDPIRTPESEKTGIDLRIVRTAARDKEGNLYAPMINAKTGKLEYIHPSRLRNLYVAFEDPKKRPFVEVLHDGEFSRMSTKLVTHYVKSPDTLFGDSTNLLPFLGNMQGNRAIMGGKQVAQALPLVNKEVPLVQVAYTRENTTYEKFVASKITPKSPVTGTIAKIEPETITIRDRAGKLHRVEKADNLPLNSKTFLHDTSVFKVGDKVKEGQLLTDGTFVMDGTLALGTNLTVGYMPYNGFVHEDSVVISETASKKLTSIHMQRKSLDINKDIVLDRAKFVTFYPNMYHREAVNNLTTDGVAKPGTKVNLGDPLILALRRSSLTATDVILGKLHKSFKTPYKDATVTWEKDFPGEVVDVKVTRSNVVLTVKYEAPAVEGDKIGGRYGNKGIIASIVPDGQMPHTKDGNVLELLMTPVGIISRINPGQVLETAVSKVAMKTGKPIEVDNFDGVDKVLWAKALLKKHNISDKEEVVDPITGKSVGMVMVGKQNILKLHKTVDTNFSARSTGAYDADEQPLKGGVEGAKKLGMMEVNALLAHNARANLREFATLKSQKNDAYWNAVRSGLPLPTPKDNFAYNKFNSMLQSMNIRMDRNGSYMSFTPMTDGDVLGMSKGEVKNPKQVKSKNLMPEEGGLFDFSNTGGLGGTTWSHISLDEPTINPIFEDSVQKLLGYATKEDLRSDLSRKGAADFKKRLNSIDLTKREAELKKQIPTLRHSKLDYAVKQLKYILALKASGIKPGDAYIISKIPVIPPVMRPIQLSSATGSLMVAGPNYLYRDLFLYNQALKDSKSSKLPEKDVQKARMSVYDGVSTVQGLTLPNSPQLQNKNIQGYLAQLTGGVGRQPKEGFIQSALLSRPADFTGRGTAAPDPNLAIDEVGIPEDQAWTMFEPFVMRALTLRGYKPLEAEEQIKNRTDLAKKLLLEVMRDRPVMVNRAPTLWRTNIVAAYPKLISGKVLKIQPLMEEGMNLDYDGDALNIHVPISPESVAEAKKMTLRYNVFSDKTRDDLLVKPTQEPVLGLYKATAAASTKKSKSYKNQNEAWNDYLKGKIELNDPIKLGK
jgi:hypothetical protein